MSVRSFDAIDYLPILSVRPAEMNALEELPERDKDQLLPIIPIGSWMAAHHLRSTLSRVEAAYGTRPIIADLSPDQPQTIRRPVHNELDLLRDPNDGYSNWCDFIEGHENFIPTIQFSDISNVRSQVRRFSNLGREIVLRVPEVILGTAPNLIRIACEEIQASKICVVLDFEKQNRSILTRQAFATGIISSLRDLTKECHIAVSASSFPDTFVGLTGQDIFERQFFDGILDVTSDSRLIYSDRGSARAERQGGGGGAPAPRIDYANSVNWAFFREEIEPEADRLAAYQRVAARTMTSDTWDDGLNLWGTQLIVRTAQGEPTAINSAQVATAARINIHLHQQLLYGAPPSEVHDTDDDWSD